jgi:hypothetical protein
MTTPDLPFLQSERMIFKLFTCEEHLKNLKKIQSQYSDLLSKEVRVSAEMEIDALISQMIGAFDCLLFRIIDKFQLTGIPIDKMDVARVISGLSAESKGGVEVAKGLQDANLGGSWYWKIKDLRNYSLHGSVFSVVPPSDVIPFFERSLVHLKEFIKNMVTKESILQ